MPMLHSYCKECKQCDDDCDLCQQGYMQEQAEDKKLIGQLVKTGEKLTYHLMLRGRDMGIPKYVWDKFYDALAAAKEQMKGQL